MQVTEWKKEVNNEKVKSWMLDEDIVEKKQRRATAMKLGMNQSNKQAEWGRKNERKKERKKGRKKGKLERRWLIRSERWRSRQKWTGKSLEERLRRTSMSNHEMVKFNMKSRIKKIKRWFVDLEEIQRECF